LNATYAKTTWLFGRGLGLVFLIAFVSWHGQQAGLIGERGIAPAVDLMRALEVSGESFWDVPTLAWTLGADDGALSAICFAGEAAALLLLLGFVPGPAAFAAALLYLSLRTVGGPFMAFQWDILLVETGWLAALVLPWRWAHPPHAVIEPPTFARWGIYALAFRLMLLSGAVKLASGDEAWARLEALEYHYWTQPLPNPLSWFVHQLPGWMHSIATAFVFVAEVGLPFAIVVALVARLVGLARRREHGEAASRAVAKHALRAAGVGFIALMTVIALTGNYGFFNLLTAVIALPLIDDALIERLVPARLKERFVRIELELGAPAKVARLTQLVLLVPVLYLGGVALTLGLGGAEQLPRAAHEHLQAARPLHLTSSYGLFAVMTTERREIVIEGSLDGTEWREYRFAHKPGDPTELPGISAPHMPRLDWQMWFAALGSFRRNAWLGRFMTRLLEAEPTVLALLADDPFDGAPPRFVRARVYDYEFGDLDHLTETGQWWVTRELGPYSPVLGRSARASRARGTSGARARRRLPSAPGARSRSPRPPPRACTSTPLAHPSSPSGG